MSQGFTSGIPNPLPVSRGGTGVVSSTGTGNVVLSTSPDLTTPTIIGVTDGSSAAAGDVGEIISSYIPNASAVSVATTDTATNLTSISLTAGDWDIWGNVTFLNSATGNLSAGLACINTTSATPPDISYFGILSIPSNANTGGMNAASFRVSITGTTTYYIIGQVTFSAGTTTMCGGIYARRVR